MKKLTERQKQFCLHYCKNGWNGTQAAIAAGYSERVASVQASENLAKPYIKAEIQRLRGNLEEVLQISKAKVLREHIRLAFSSIAHLHDTWVTRKEFEDLTEDQKACIESIETRQERKDTEGGPVITEWVKIKLFDKQRALDSISKLMGYDAPIKAELSGTIDIKQITGLKVE